MEDLDYYFKNQVSEKIMRDFLVNQFEVTAYRIFGSFLAQKKDLLNQSPPIEVTYLGKLIEKRMLEIEKIRGSEPKFQIAKQSFEKVPFSSETFIKILPFLEHYLANNTPIYDVELTAIFRLENNDLKMFDMFDKLEKKHKLNETFLSRMAKRRFSQKEIANKHLELNLGLLHVNKIKKYTKEIESNLRDMRVPISCKKEREYIAKKLNCSVCLEKSDDSMYSLYIMCEDIAQLLFDALLTREDLKLPRIRYLKESLWE